MVYFVWIDTVLRGKAGGDVGWIRLGGVLRGIEG